MARFEIEIPDTHLRALEMMADADQRTRKNYCETAIRKQVESASVKVGNKWVIKKTHENAK